METIKAASPLPRQKLRILCIVEKSPGDPRRKGPVEDQDWYRQVREAAMYNVYPNTEVWCFSATQLSGLEPAVDYYDDAAVHSGIRLYTRMIGYETVSQLDAYELLAVDREADLILFVTKAHLKRVQWICIWKGIKAEFVVCEGIPNPRERITDYILEIAYPIMYKLGVLEWFLRQFTKRRMRANFSLQAPQSLQNRRLFLFVELSCMIGDT